VTVALDHLRRHRCRLQIPGARKSLFDLRREVRALPTAPENFPTRISSAAAVKRAMSRCVSEYQFASFNPNVIGSAWMPCVRPMALACL
jgi:hypothetical protein